MKSLPPTSVGFTVIEIVITIAIIGVLVAVVTIPFSTFRRQQSLENTTNAIVSMLGDARAKTLAAYNNTSYGIHFETNDAILFTGTTYQNGAATNEAYQYEYPVTTTWSLNGGGNDISFDRLKGSTSSYGTITVQLPNGVSHTVTVTSLGTVARN